MLQKITGNKMILGAVVGIVGGLIVAVLLVVVMGIGRSPSVAAEGTGKPGEKVAAATTAGEKAAPKAGATAGAGEAGAKFGPAYVIKDRIVNLADPGGRRYLRFSVAVEFEAPAVAAGGGEKSNPDKEFQAAIKKFVPAIEDSVTSVLSSKTYEDVRSLEGKDLAKREIKDRVQRVLGEEERVTNVYFTDFVVQ